MARLSINLVDGANLCRGTLELHLIDTADARQRAVQVLHLLRVARQTLALLRNLLEHLRQTVQLVDIVGCSILQVLGHIGRNLSSRSTASGNHSTAASAKANWLAFPTGSLVARAYNTTYNATTIDDDRSATSNSTR